MLAAAFQDDPVMAYIFPDPVVRRARLPGFLSVIFNSDLPAGACFMTAQGEAATTWRAPGRGHLSFREMLQQAWPWIATSRTALARALIVSAASDANHPKGPHWYLHIAGCAPQAQGKGFGGAAIRAGLARSDAAGIAAYLETANEANLPVYSALGFRVTHDWTVGSGLRCWSMLRNARTSSALTT
ncbi:N-acetyltransferase [Beijerinckia sp. L45]|uniref:GNAT family N-acetyltransferase n=1 Tax=Beijerinckia sp. L45 TaxID=1641855 RepID=UPI00131D94F7|nr:GNAT family N-acetyltransferase [Beijerinckia sp. L45]